MITYETRLGSVNFADGYLSKLIGNAVSTCYGVVGMAFKNTTDSIASLLKWDSITKGIKVNTEDEKISIDLHVIVEYGVNIKVICESIISNVKYAVESATGFKVGKVTVNVEGVRVDN